MSYRIVPALFATAVIILLHSASPAHGSQRFALLIGNQGYNDKVGMLTNPHNDVELVAKSLTQLGFQVRVVKDARGDAFRKEIYDYVALVREAGPETISFFYYSGHGASDEKTKSNYLIPVDVPSAEDSSLWSHSLDIKTDVIEKFRAQAPDAIQYVIFDACRNELKLPKGKALVVAGKGFLPVEHQTNNILVAFSTAPNRTATDTGFGNGPYARALAEELLRPNVEAVTMFRTVHLRVLQSTGQEPWLGVPSLPEVVLAKNPGQALKHADTPATGSRNVIDAEAREAAEIEAYNRERSSAYKTIETESRNPFSLQPIGATSKVSKRWGRSVLTLCFVDGDIDRRRYVARIARQWTLYGKIDFDFGHWLEPEMCSRHEKPADIRITFGQKGDWSYVGTDNLKASASEPTLSLESLRDASLEDIGKGNFDRTILHQFGHVLGFDDERNLPRFRCYDDEVNWDNVYAYMKKNYDWSSETVDQWYRRIGSVSRKPLRSERQVGLYFSTLFWSSIMDTVEAPEEFFQKGGMRVGKNFELKESDCSSDREIRKLPKTLTEGDQLRVFGNYQ